MRPRLFSILLALRRLNQSDLARAAGVSRQAVSRWSRGKAGLRARHLLNLCRSLGIRPEQLDLESPLLENDNEWQRTETLYCWDRLYPSLEEFVAALAREDPRALARVVQVDGIFAAEKIIGPKIWKLFPKLAPFVHPTRRRELETMVRVLNDEGLISA